MSAAKRVFVVPTTVTLPASSTATTAVLATNIVTTNQALGAADVSRVDIDDNVTLGPESYGTTFTVSVKLASEGYTITMPGFASYDDIQLGGTITFVCTNENSGPDNNYVTLLFPSTTKVWMQYAYVGSDSTNTTPSNTRAEVNVNPAVGRIRIDVISQSPGDKIIVTYVKKSPTETIAFMQLFLSSVSVCQWSLA